MKGTLLITLLLSVMDVISCNVINCNNDSIPGSEFQINSGIYSLSSIDQLYSEKMYCGANVYLGLGYLHFNTVSRHQLEVEIARMIRKPLNLPVREDQIVFGSPQLNTEVYHLNYTYFYPLRQNICKNLNLFVTGSINNFINNSRNSYCELLNCSLAPGLYLESKGMKHHFFFKVSIPLISLSARKNYATNTAQDFETFNNWNDLTKNMRLLTPGQEKGVCANIGYTFNLSKQILWSVAYSLDYLKITYPRDLTSVSGIYSTCFIYKLKRHEIKK